MTFETNLPLWTLQLSDKTLAQNVEIITKAGQRRGSDSAGRFDVGREKVTERRYMHLCNRKVKRQKTRRHAERLIGCMFTAARSRKSNTVNSLEMRTQTKAMFFTKFEVGFPGIQNRLHKSTVTFSFVCFLFYLFVAENSALGSTLFKVFYWKPVANG